MHVPDTAPTAWAAVPNLASRLSSLYMNARQAWPDVEFDEVAFTAYLARHWPHELPPDAYLESVKGEDLYLAGACAHGMRGAVEAFDQRFMRLIPKTLAHMRLGQDVLEDLQQELRTRLLVAPPGELPRIASYAGRGSLEKWLQATAIRLALNWLDRAENRNRIDSEEESVLLERMARRGETGALRSAELALQQDAYREVTKDSLRVAFQQLSREQRTLLRLHYLDGLRMEEIGSLLGVHKATISRRLTDARARILESVKEELGRRLASTESVVNSVLTLVQSQLDESLSTLLRSTADVADSPDA